MDFSSIEGVIAISTAVISTILSTLGYFLNKWNKKKVQLDVILKYYQEGDEEELVESRSNILERHHQHNKQDTENNKFYNKNQRYKDESNICNFFNKWAFMIKVNYLPFYIFKGSSGTGLMNIYDALSDYIDFRREDNSEYAKEFEYLYRRVKNLRSLV